MENLLDNLKELLKKDERLINEGELLKNKIIELALKFDKDLIKLLLDDEKMKGNLSKDFEDLSNVGQKRFLLGFLDKNHLYVNYNEINDEEYGVSEDDKRLNREFYDSERT
jgi:adenine-specific DNA-methyltransferase